jgi:hypothetical protein
MTSLRSTKFVLALISLLAIWLSVPVVAHAKGTIGHSTESTNGNPCDPPAPLPGQPAPPQGSPCETPQITEFQMNAINDADRRGYDERAGAHPIINFWMRFCDTDSTVGANDVNVRDIEDASGTPIRITTKNPHTLQTGNFVTVQRVEGNTAANVPPGQTAFRVTVPPDDPSTPLNEANRTFILDGTASNGTYVPDTGTASYLAHFGCNNRQVQLHNLMKDFRLGLPPGLLTNPTAVTPCEVPLFVIGACPPESVIGYSAALGIYTGGINGPPIATPTPLAVVKPFAEPARLGTYVLPAEPPGPLPILVNLRTGGPQADFGVDSVVDSLPTALNGQFAKLFTIDTFLCARVPCTGQTLDPIDPATAKPSTVNPTSCKPATTTLFARPWPYPPDPPGPPSHAESTYVPSDCDNVPFSPTVTVDPVSKTASEPTSVQVAIQYPDYVYADRWQSALKDAEVILPDGMSLAAGGGVGLESCPEDNIGMGTDEPVNCPEGSRIGKVKVDSPALANPLFGKAYLSIPPGQSGAPTEANPWKLFIVLEGQGVRVKLEGTVALIDNPATGDPNDRLIKNVFAKNPEVPFTRFELTTKGPDAVDADNKGAAALANPDTCGVHKGDVKLYGYKNLRWVDKTTGQPLTDPTDPNGEVRDTKEFVPVAPEVNITGNCDKPFQPVVTTATAAPEDAGANSVSHLTIERPDGHQNISRLNFSLPPGALGSLASAPRCPAADAAVGNCPDSTKVGIIRNTVGYGSSNLTVAGSLYIGEALQPGDAASFIIKVPAKVGPIDLGNVIVANRVQLRKTDTGVDVLSGEIPTLLQGIPLPLQKIDILVNRENFFLNPTGCDTRTFTATFFSDQGATATSSKDATATNCDKVPFGPKLRIIAGAKGFTGVGDLTALKAIVTQSDGQSNIRSAKVIIPDIIRPNVPRFQKLENLCTPAQAAASACPDSSLVGNARVKSPVLPFELSGPVYVVYGAAGEPLPRLAVFLRGGGFEITLSATNGFSGIKILNTFAALPDAAQSYFELNIMPGPKSALLVHDDLCTTSPLPSVEYTFTAQSGKVFSDKSRLEANGCASALTSLSIGNQRVRITRKGVAKIRVRCAKGGPRCRGRMTLAKRYGKKSLSIAAGKSARIKVKLSRKARRAVLRSRKGKRIRVTVTPRGGGRRDFATVRLLRPKKKH